MYDTYNSMDAQQRLLVCASNRWSACDAHAATAQWMAGNNGGMQRQHSTQFHPRADAVKQGQVARRTQRQITARRAGAEKHSQAAVGAYLIH